MTDRVEDDDTETFTGAGDGLRSVMTTDTWFSDEALRKQAEADALIARGEPVPLSVMCGIFQPRTQPTAVERCTHCQSDAREGAGGEEIDGKRWCFLCISRGRDEPEVAS